jgi:hypothetical protein
MQYKSALKAAFYDLTAARDQYRLTTVASGLGMHKDCVKVYVQFQAQLLAPIAPHWCDSIWQEILKQASLFPLINHANRLAHIRHSREIPRLWNWWQAPTDRHHELRPQYHLCHRFR